MHGHFYDQANQHLTLFGGLNNQDAITTLPKELPSRIDNHKNIYKMPNCTKTDDHATTLQDSVNSETVSYPGDRAPLDNLGPGSEYFALSEGRIVPCRALVTNVGAYDPFTKREELILYKRFKAVITASPPGRQEVAESSSEAWWEFWAKVSKVLPERGVMKCIAFYVANKEHFQHT
ncbi:hypothetical protein MBLNU13_g10906t1 [Cladosporium sp. NU13]